MSPTGALMNTPADTLAPTVPTRTPTPTKILTQVGFSGATHATCTPNRATHMSAGPRSARLQATMRAALTAQLLSNLLREHMSLLHPVRWFSPRHGRPFTRTPPPLP